MKYEGTVKGNDPSLHGEKVKRYLRKGARELSRHGPVFYRGTERYRWYIVLMKL